MVFLPIHLNYKDKVMAKITVIGAGNVGATCANVMAQKELASEIVLLDIKEGLAEGKALDMMQTSTLSEFDTRIIGVTNDYTVTANSKIVVITSGIPRKPGMTREELIGTNADIVKTVIDNVLKQSPEAIIIVISNPVDTMTYLALKTSKLPKQRIIGMGGMLDTTRFKLYISKALDVPTSDVGGIVVGGHGDTSMIPLSRFATYKGFPVRELLSKEVLDTIVADTKLGGATLTKLIGTSAWYAPGTTGALLAEAIIRDQRKMYPCCVYLDGEYGQKDICIGVPVMIGKNGWEKIIDYRLNAEEQEAFNKSADAVRNMNNIVKGMNLI
jgi:malate dehydrogenase